MDISIIRTLAEKRDGGMRKLASDIGMSEANLHRCVNNNKIQASVLEQVAISLDVDVRIFFDMSAVKIENKSPENSALLQLCKAIVNNYQQRDEIMSKLVSMVKAMED